MCCFSATPWQGLILGTFTDNLLLVQPTPFDPAVKNVWGTILNGNDGLLDDAVAGLLSLDVSAGATIILTSVGGASDQARQAIFDFTGTLPNATTILWPQSITGRFLVHNNTSGAFSLSLGANDGSGSAAGAVAVIPQGARVWIYSDGVNVYLAGNIQPTRQILTSGSAQTYTTPFGCTRIVVRAIAGGGGGASQSGAGSDGNTGGTTSFNGITVLGGVGGSANGNAGTGGTGGSNTPTSGSVTGLFRTDGNSGGGGAAATASTAAVGGSGGAGIFGGGTANTNSAKPNTGAGGSGQGISSAAAFSGGGGGAGESVQFTINAPAGTYIYTIGTAAAGGLAAGNGGSGVTIVDEYYS